MVEKGRVEALKPVIEATLRACKGVKIVAVFGNEEYIGTEDQYLKLYGDKVVWLNDSFVELSDDVVVYGTRGSLDRLTSWQRRHMPWLARTYRERAEKLAEQVATLKKRYRHVIVVMHYAPTYATLEGEPKSIWPELGSSYMENAIRRSKPTLVIHGHAHRSSRLVANVDGVPVYNVALPAKRDLTLIHI
jgi:Icc-related predicted phosphoesterase